MSDCCPVRKSSNRRQRPQYLNFFVDPGSRQFLPTSSLACISSYSSHTNSSAVDLAVDWLNDKVYWADAELGHIEEYDIATGRRKVVASTGEAGETIPVAMALYPYPNYG